MNENKYTGIIESILIERENQNVKHPVLPKYFLHPKNGPALDDITQASKYAKLDNDNQEAFEEHDWYNIMREKLYETFEETDLHKMRAEAIQGAALYVRMIETIDVMIKEKE
jgi:hypothetical protein